MNWAKKCRLLAEKSQSEMAQALEMHVNTYIRKEKQEDLFTVGEIKRIAAITKSKAEDIFLPDAPQM